MALGRALRLGYQSASKSFGRTFLEGEVSSIIASHMELYQQLFFSSCNLQHNARSPKCHWIPLASASVIEIAVAAPVWVPPVGQLCPGPVGLLCLSRTPAQGGHTGLLCLPPPACSAITKPGQYALLLTYFWRCSLVPSAPLLTNGQTLQTGSFAQPYPACSSKSGAGRRERRRHTVKKHPWRKKAHLLI